MSQGTDVQTEERYQVTKRDLRKTAARYNFMACNIFNNESQMGPAIAWAMAPVLRKIYKKDEDFEYARTLMRKAFYEYNANMEIIDKFTYNWELDRISEMDKLIMSCAISELKHFPSIPVKVTLDEYIEISKTYSSPKSGAFINGVLDKAVALLKDTNEIVKAGRGLLDETEAR